MRLTAVEQDPPAGVIPVVPRGEKTTMINASDVRIYADPYKKCMKCGEWIDGAHNVGGPLMLFPCGHRSDYRDVCPSWSPVDGCTCADQPTPIVHDMRPPADDGHTY
jgi:hypothetical protein